MKVVDTAADLFKRLVWDRLVDLAVKKIATKVLVRLPAWLAGPLGWIIGEVVTWIASEIFSVVKEFIAFEAIAFINKEHQVAFDRASVELKILAMQKGIDSIEYKEAREHAKKSLSTFVRYTP